MHTTRRDLLKALPMAALLIPGGAAAAIPTPQFSPDPLEPTPRRTNFSPPLTDPGQLRPPGSPRPCYYDAALEAQYTRNGNINSTSWTGGDTTYSIELPDGNSLFVFNDAILSPMLAGGRRAPSAYVRNVFTIRGRDFDGRAVLFTVSMPRRGNPPAAPMLDYLDRTVRVPRWTWLMHGGVEGDEVVVFGGDRRWDPDPRYVFGRQARTQVQSFATGFLIPAPRPNFTFEGPRAWGLWVLRDPDGYRYVYGLDTDAEGEDRRVYVARTRDLRDRSSYRFYDGKGAAFGERSPGRAAGIDGLPPGLISNQFCVLRVAAGHYVLLSQEHSVFEARAGRGINAWAARTPFGPFANRKLLFTTPAWEPYGRTPTRRVNAQSNPPAYDNLTYNSVAHVALSSPAEGLLVSFNRNVIARPGVPALDPLHPHWWDPSSYRPHFVRVPYANLPRP